MYKVLIADDEEIVYKGMCNIVEWQRLGFCILDFAENGKVALEKLKKEYYHLIITDIRMPLIDGLELIQEIRRISPDTRIIILSGYSEFAYAQKAIEYGVKSYLVKPVDREKLRDIVLGIKAELDAKTEDDLILSEGIHALKDKFICDITYGYLTEAEIAEKCRRYGLDFKAEGYFVALFQIANFLNLVAKDLESARAILQSAKDTIENLVKENKTGLVYEDAEGVIGVLLFRERVLSFFSNESQWAQYICACLSKGMGLEMLAGTGEPAEQLKDVKISRGQAYKALVQDSRSGDKNGFSLQKLPKIVNQILLFIDEHYREDLTLKSIAKRFYLNPAYLGQLLIKTTGEAFNDYLNKKRISEVKRLLPTQEYTAMELIEKAGYRNPEYFYRQFKRYEGKKFSDYRTSLHE